MNANPSFPDHRWATETLGGVRDFQTFVYRLGEDRRFQSDVRRYIHFRDQLDWVSEPNGSLGRRILVDFVGRYEKLEWDWPKLVERLNVDVTLPKEREASDRSDYRLAYENSRMVDIVGDIYSNDVRSFGYSFE